MILRTAWEIWISFARVHIIDYTELAIRALHSVFGRKCFKLSSYLHWINLLAEFNITNSQRDRKRTRESVNLTHEHMNTWPYVSDRKRFGNFNRNSHIWWLLAYSNVLFAIVCSPNSVSTHSCNTKKREKCKFGSSSNYIEMRELNGVKSHTSCLFSRQLLSQSYCFSNQKSN